MRVLKIIQANKNVFNFGQNHINSEKEAIRNVASMDCPGNETQKENFEIRQTHTAICNLIDLGYMNTSIELSIKLIARAEKSHNYKIAHDLCERLITYFYIEGNMSAVNIYKTLYDKFSLILTNEHKTMLLFGKTIHNNNHLLPLDKEALAPLFNAIDEKLHFDIIWYHYYFYHCKSLILTNLELENNYLEALAYFKQLPLQHNLFVRVFSNCLIRLYKDRNAFEKAYAVIENLRNLPNSDL